MPLRLEQPAVAFIGEEAGSLGQVELEQAGSEICWKPVISVRDPVLLTVCFSGWPRLSPGWLTVLLFSGCRPCVKLCKETAWKWTFWTANGDMGRQLPLITCVDSPGAERQKPPVTCPDLQLEFCAEGNAFEGLHLICILPTLFHGQTCLQRPTLRVRTCLSWVLELSLLTLFNCLVLFSFCFVLTKALWKLS